MKRSAILAAALAGASAFGATFYEENFRFYPDHPPAFADDTGIVVNQDGVWAFWGYMECRPTTDLTLLAKDVALPAAGFKGEMKFFFNAKGQQTDKAGVVTNKGDVAHFDIVFKDKAGKAEKVRIAPGSFGGVPREFTKNGAEVNLGFAVKGREIEYFFTPGRGEYKSIGKKSLTLEPAAFNLAVYADKGLKFHKFKLMTADEPFTTHPVEKHFADFRSLAQTIRGGQTAKGGEKIVLKGGRFTLKVKLNATNNMAKIYAPDRDGKPPKAPGMIRTDVHNNAVTTPYAQMNVRPTIVPFAAAGESGISGVVPQWDDVKREWARLPKAADHVTVLEFVRNAEGGWMVYQDGNAARNVPAAEQLVFEPGAGVSWRMDENVYPAFDAAKYFPIDLAANPRAKAMADASLKGVKAGVQALGGAPVKIVDPIDSADVAICHFAKGNWALECEEYFGRNPWMGFPMAVHYRIPAALYVKAHLVFALDPDPKKDKILTMRLVRMINHGCGGNMRADAVLDFTKGVPGSCRKIGEVAVKGQTVPLYYAAVPLDAGDIIDLLAKDQIDFEFIGKGYETTQQLDYSMKPHPGSDSAFNVFGVTLEKAPFKAHVKQATPGNVFTADEKDKATTMRLVSTAAGAGTVAWTARDLDGKDLFSGKKAWKADGASVTNDVAVDLSDARQGCWKLDFDFLDAKGAKLFTHHGAFAVLPPAGRVASRKESPYCVWWFGYNHGSTGDDAIGCLLMQKAGIRKSTWYSPKPEVQDKYDIAGGGVCYAPIRHWTSVDREKMAVKENLDYKDPATGKKVTSKTAEEFFVASIGNALKDIRADTTKPHLLYWHESAPSAGGVPPAELTGDPAPETLPYPGAQMDAVWLNTLSEALHKHFPGVPLQLGNSTHSLGAIVGPMRAGAKASVYDCVGIETPSQTVVPERLIDCGLQGMHMTMDTAEAISGQKIKANGSWEFVYRTSRDLGEIKQAEWYTRDIIICLAHDFFLIAPGVFFDCTTGYYDGLWGGAGLLYRAPWVYPKPAYVAYAVATKALDGAKLVRQLDTGSTTVYAFEFKRADGKTATALWASKGDVDFKVKAASGFLGRDAGTLMHMLGAEEPLAGGESLVKGGTSPCYLITGKPLESVTIAGRSYPREDAIAAAAKVGAKLDNADELTLAPDPQIETRGRPSLPYMKPCGEFTMQTVQDDEKGACVELALGPAKTAPQNKFVDRYVTRYTTMRLKEPKAIPGEPAVIGVWVKGDSNWGQIRFEIEDATGEVFRNLTTGSWWCCDIFDWPGNLAVNFDGWSYVCCSLQKNDWITEVSPGLLQEQWSPDGSGDKKIQYPLKLRAITVGMNRSKLNVTGFEPAANVLRFKDAGGAGNK